MWSVITTSRSLRRAALKVNKANPDRRMIKAIQAHKAQKAQQAHKAQKEH